MLSTALRRSLARHSAFPNRRLYSSPSESTQKKAQDTLASAQKNASKLWESSKKYLDPLTEKAGQMLGSYKQPLLYNLSVTKEVLKQIYVAEALQPPTLSAVRQAYESIWYQVSRSGALGKLVRDGEVARVGIYGLQAYGIFKIGEIVGRRSLVGYDLH
ncbi:hypothetical protein K443DRAFT_685758 [Laccaria amethystina LaAM-08-1]|uniref:ATP synthase subunit n=1 Tax=Laccaria amethystina LaAM-08-1 TaxID=1095629 RepID=A0A0C9X5F3_9AGAR|nr:hypothetical protein K443DRAFT_685758 [Laccaria amethystina LaAM-08-1]